MLGFVVLWILAGIVTGVIASSKGRSGFGWFLIGCLLGVFGILLVGFLPPLKDPMQELPIIGDDKSRVSEVATQSRLFSNSQAGSVDQQGEPHSARLFDTRKWQVLKEVDDDIAMASKRISLLDEKLESEMAEKYLTLNDKTYLASIERQLAEKFHFNKNRLHAMVAAMEADEAAAVLREMESYRDALAESGGVDPSTKLKVIKFEPYFGKWKSAQGE